MTAAGTSIGNCYVYFSNKEAILFAIGDQLRAEVSDEIDACIADIEIGPRRFAVRWNLQSLGLSSALIEQVREALLELQAT